MRFDDLLETVMAMRGHGAGLAVTRWRQCVDLLAQRAGDTTDFLASEEIEQLLASLDDVRQRVPLSQKVASVVELGSWLRSPVLVRFLAGDHPAVATATMGRARLADDAWAALIPTVGPLARSVLRRRGDLGLRARAALDAFGKTDMALEYAGRAPEEQELDTGLNTRTETLVADDAGQADRPSPIEPVETHEPALAEPTNVMPFLVEVTAQTEEEPEPALSEISRIVDRIEAFRSQRERALPRDDEADIAQRPEISRFQFETDESGSIRSVAGAPRGAAIGLSIGSASIDGRSGADGQGLGAFRHRATFHDVRFVVNSGVLEGEWRVSAEPRFSTSTGRFEGYMGEARRALAHEMSVCVADNEAGWGALSAATARQLVHELRTPLNAIQGFAEIIERQMFGPVPSDYREMAARILSDARRLLATFDDLDLASRLLRGDVPMKADVHRIEDLILRSIEPFGKDGSGEAAIDLHIPQPLPPVRINAALAERLLMHLFRTFAALRSEGERLAVSVERGGDDQEIRLEVTVPAILQAWPEDEIYRESAQMVDEDVDGPPLGSAFSLRLVRTLAESCGGRFRIGEGMGVLTLPAFSEEDRNNGDEHSREA
ncbi:sensor histidine kinase [Sphingobium sp. CR28]|uniref:sensor histidine kinase n=1 Tax=Sphingobium sp. CR28 TaxID=3400272 RepID=UPI003FED3CF4